VNLLGLGRARVVRRTRIIGFTRKNKGIPFSTKIVGSTSANGGQDGDHQNEYEEHCDPSHVERRPRKEGQVPMGKRVQI
jgi:hypothetical protein